jgi:hypothetical protein
MLCDQARDPRLVGRIQAAQELVQSAEHLFGEFLRNLRLRGASGGRRRSGVSFCRRKALSASLRPASIGRPATVANSLSGKDRQPLVSRFGA